MERSSRNFQLSSSNRKFQAIFASPNRYFIENSRWVPLPYWHLASKFVTSANGRVRPPKRHYVNLGKTISSQIFNVLISIWPIFKVQEVQFSDKKIYLRRTDEAFRIICLERHCDLSGVINFSLRRNSQEFAKSNLNPINSIVYAKKLPRKQ